MEQVFVTARLSADIIRVRGQPVCSSQALCAISSHRGLTSVMLTGPVCAVGLAEISILHVSSSVCCLSIMTFNQQASAKDTSSLSSVKHTHISHSSPVL